VRLAPRLILSIGFLAAASSAGLGLTLREDRRRDETERFDSEVRSACVRVASEVGRQAEADRKLVAGACQAGELVDRALLAIGNGELDERRLALAALVPKEREAFDLDELILVTDPGDILGADPRALLGTPRAALEDALRGDPSRWTLRKGAPASITARCVRRGRDAPTGQANQAPAGRAVGLLGARYLGPLLERLGTTAGVGVSLGEAKEAAQSPDAAEARCSLTDPAGGAMTIVVAKSKAALDENLARIDRTILLAAIASTGAALLLAVLLARSVGRPIEELAREARKVAADQAQPLGVRGSGELAELAQAFDRMLDDLGTTRRRLAAASRIAAWREVARRVAHEVKNPLAPIRAAVETLRRLRARNDPAFDDYFDEATRTVLDEVHRISDIVTEFTRFARLPAPRPQDVDVDEVVRHVVQLHRAAAGDGVRIEQSGPRSLPHIRADRDQLVQVLTNLVQNAIDAVRERGGEITVAASLYGTGTTHVAIAVTDDGPGIQPEMSAHLFEPYATTKAKGTGLGLAIAQRIAIEHDGELAYLGPASATGGRSIGARFRLVLPLAGPPPSGEPTPTLLLHD
jgi:two-component system nitrogen regulation sensor histidine kinase NtrY